MILSKGHTSDLLGLLLPEALLLSLDTPAFPLPQVDVKLLIAADVNIALLERLACAIRGLSA